MKRRKPLTRRKGLKARSTFRARSWAGAAGTLWAAIEGHPVARFGFRPDQRVGPFVVDVVCPGAKLAIVIEDQPSNREEWLRAAGYRVLTFTRQESSNPQAVLDAIVHVFELRSVPTR